MGKKIKCPGNVCVVLENNFPSLWMNANGLNILRMNVCFQLPSSGNIGLERLSAFISACSPRDTTLPQCGHVSARAVLLSDSTTQQRGEAVSANQCRKAENNESIELTT